MQSNTDASQEKGCVEFPIFQPYTGLPPLPYYFVWREIGLGYRNMQARVKMYRNTLPRMTNQPFTLNEASNKRRKVVRYLGSKSH